ncbi:unnamed protein product [Phytomonas sp. Hart1]|nr:unnamed protein product [Phytomonas sp. Hart1]|eukprot:CCW68106.1 unnamed protein product [Phytomonas sp. isolate Hart1]
MEDIEQVPIDPWFLHAAGRHLARPPPESPSLTLQAACEAVCQFGCLEAAAAPTGFWTGREMEGKEAAAFLRAAFVRRRGGVYAVDGPYGNLFDNIRSVLWRFKHQRRCVLVAIKASINWFDISNGVIANERAAPRGGFYTTVKVIGQSVLNNEVHLILQGHFGPRVGHRGFFYITKNLFNRYTTGNAYIFLDLNSFLNPRGGSIQSFSSVEFARKVVSPCVRELFDQLSTEITQLNKGFSSLVNFSLQRCAPNLTDIQLCSMLSVLQRIPPSLFFMRESENRTGVVFSDSHHGIAKFVATFLSHIHPVVSISELIFLLSEVIGVEVCRWLCFTLKTFSQQSISCPIHWDMKERQPSPLLSAPPEDESVGSSHENWVSISRFAFDTPGPEEPGSHSPTLNNLTLEYHSLDRADAAATALNQVPDPIPDTKPHLHIAPEDQTRRLEEAASEELCFDHLGKHWNAVHLCNDDGTLSSLIICFLGNAACLYDLAASRVVQPLTKINPYSTFLVEFPFTRGVDCAFNHPLRSSEVFLFSSGMFAIWDAVKRKCLLGPRIYSKCQQLAHLPEIFRGVEGNGIFAALPFPGTPLVVFFSRSQEYVVYDLEKEEVRFSGAISRTRKEVPSTVKEKEWNSLDMGDQHVSPLDIHNSSDKLSEVDNHEPLAIPFFSEEIMHRFITGGIPMAVLQAENDVATHRTGTSDAHAHKVGTSTILLLPMASGEVLNMKVDPCAVEKIQWLSLLSVIPMRDSKLARLPVSFRQVAIEVLPQMCSVVVDHEVRTNPHFASLVLYQPSSPETNINIEPNSHCSLPADTNSPFDQTTLLCKNTGVVVTAHQWASTSHTEEITFPNSFLSFSSSIASEEMGINITGNKEEVCHYYYPNQNAEVAVDKDGTSSSFKSWVLFDFGVDQAESFGAVIIVTNMFFDSISNFPDLPFVIGSDVRLFIESSEDGTSFQRVALNFTVRGYLVFASWQEVSAAQYWRIVLEAPVNSPTLAPLSDFGIVRVLWYRAVWQPTLCELGVLEAFIPFPDEDSQEVCIVAPCVEGKPESFLSCNASSAVFMAPTSYGWWERRSVLPLPREDDPGVASSALFFAEAPFLRWT